MFNKKSAGKLYNFKIDNITFMPTRRPEGMLQSSYIVVKYNSSSSAVNRNPEIDSHVVDRGIDNTNNTTAQSILEELQDTLKQQGTIATIRKREGYETTDGQEMTELRVKDNDINLTLVQEFLAKKQKEGKRIQASENQINTQDSSNGAYVIDVEKISSNSNTPHNERFKP